MQYANFQPYPFYQPSPAQIKKSNEIRTLKKKSSGLGFYILTYFLSMSVIIGCITFFMTLFMMMNMDILNYDTEALTQQILTKITSGPVYYYMQILGATASAAIPGFIYLKLSKTHISDCITVKSVKPAMLIALTLMGMGVAMVSNVASDIVCSNFSSIGIEYNLDMGLSSKTIFENILYIIAVAITPAFAEEFAFRGILMGALRKYGNSFAIITSAVLFGAMHGNIIQIPFAFILGLIFGYIDCKANSIIPSIIIHFLNNFYSVIMDILQSESIVTTHTFYIIYYGLFVAMLVLGISAFLYIMKKDKNFLSISDTSAEVSLTLKEKLTCFFTSGGVITILVFLIIETLVVTVML